MGEARVDAAGYDDQGGRWVSCLNVALLVDWLALNDKLGHRRLSVKTPTM
jgi:hypothetical protein